MLEVETSQFNNQFLQFTEERIDQFIERQKQDQAKVESEGRRPNRSIADLIQRSKSMPPEIVDNIFNPYLKQKLAEDSIDEVRKSLHAMRLKINTLDSRKRFLILETMDFFRSKISIGKLIPAVLLFQDVDRKKAFLQIIIPAFQSLKSNVETLVSIDALFSPKTLHLNRGSLYSFIADLAKIILPVFKQEYRDRFSTILSPVELLGNLLKPFQLQGVEQDYSKYRLLIDDNSRIQSILLNFVVSIQSHEALFNYAVKRNAYYKLVLNQLTGDNCFKGYDPFLISKILAGCFIGNEQIKPASHLIAAMVDKERYAKPSTTKAKKSFVDKLAPSTVLTIIKQFKTLTKLLFRHQLPSEFSEILDLSIHSVLLKIWNGFTSLANDGLHKFAAPLEIVFNQLKKTLRSFNEDETKAEQGIIYGLNQPFAASISKQPGFETLLKKNYRLVVPDIIGFRGILEGASHKDEVSNARIFKNEEITQLEFVYCFRRLFEFLVLRHGKKVQMLTQNRSKQIIEYHASFLSGHYLICLGLTHKNSVAAVELQEKDIIPYILLFTESTVNKPGSITSRMITIRGKQRLFNEAAITPEISYLQYKSILHLLHLLPNEDWNASASQACIKFLIRELNQHSG